MAALLIPLHAVQPAGQVCRGCMGHRQQAAGLSELPEVRPRPRRPPPEAVLQRLTVRHKLLGPLQAQEATSNSDFLAEPSVIQAHFYVKQPMNLSAHIARRMPKTKKLCRKVSMTVCIQKA